jgi:N-acetylglucosamine-6-sulfatase
MQRNRAAAGLNVLWIIDDDHPQYMMASMPITRQQIRDVGSDFTLGHADISLCGPARTSLLTGLAADHHGCLTNRTWPEFTAFGYNQKTVARYLKEAGYVTGHFGKYVNAKTDHTYQPAPYFDRWCETEGREDSSANSVSVDGQKFDLPSSLQPSIWAANRCADFIRARADRTWFAQYCPTIPHKPYTPSRDAKHLYDGARRQVPSVNEADMSDKPAWMRGLPAHVGAGAQADYEGKLEELADLDRKGITNILAALRETRQLANTVIFYVSDNGYLHGEHRLRQKDQPYWESAQIPFFVKGPGVRASKRTVLTSHVDLFPTTLEIAGLDPASFAADGRSMWPHLGAASFSGWRRRMLVAGSDVVGPEENPGGANNPSGRWWLLREDEKAFVLHENGTKELYWMGVDPYQERNRARTADPALIARLTDTTRAMIPAFGNKRRRLEVA